MLKGTPATQSQLAKDVTEFLRWSSEKSHDDKKKLLLKVMKYLLLMITSFKIKNEYIFLFDFIHFMLKIFQVLIHFEYSIRMYID